MGRQHTVRQANRQSRQHTASRSKAASNQSLEEQRRKVDQAKFKLSSSDKNRLIFAARLLQRHTWLLWIVAFSILVGSATAAITTILDPDASIPYSPAFSPAFSVAASPPAATNSPKESPAPTPARSASPIPSTAPESLPRPLRQQPELPDQPSTASPQSAVGAIALSCAAGCFLLSQGLKPRPASKRRVLFESQSSAKRTQQDQPVQAANLAAVVTPALLDAPELSNLPRLPAAPTISFDLKPAELQSAETPVAEIVEVSVLPAEQSHPLDWDEPSLADSLDLRQRRPLSYWL